MSRRRGLRIALLGSGLLLSLLLAAGPAPPAGAAPAPDQPVVLSLRQAGPPNAMPAVTIIECSIASPRDTVTVYRTTGSMAWSDDWRRATNFDGSLWTYDIGSTGQPRLAIEFAEQDGRRVARLFSELASAGPPPGPGRPPKLPELPAVVVTTAGHWVLPDGSIDLDFELSLDGPMRVPLGLYLGEERASALALPREYQPRLDGRPDWLVEVHPASADYPAYELWRENLQVPERFGFIRSGLQVMPVTRALRYDATAFWPLLGDSGLLGRGTLDRQPPISIDWASGRVSAVGSFLPNVAPQAGFQITSLRPLRKGGPNEPDFENPFAFYDLARRDDEFPDLQVRVASFPPHDRYSAGGSSGEPRQTVRYSWDQYHRRQWDYKLDLAGSQPLPGEVRLPDFSVRSVPYQDLPGWIVDREWDFAAFVASEDQATWTSEGIYAWDTPPAVAERFMNGRDDAPDLSAYANIPVGLRGELRRPGLARPWLYFSPIDRRLHLGRAQSGVWNRGHDRELRYSSLSGEYLDTWSLQQDGREIMALYLAGDQLILSDGGGLRLRRVDLVPALFTALPPADSRAWSRLGERLAEQAASFEGDDLAAMFDRQDGPVESLPGAALSALRLTGDGFRFALRLPTGQVGGVPWTTGLPPGEYVVRYRATAGYAAEPLRPPTLTPQALSFTTDGARVLEPLEIVALLRNDGNGDAQAAPLRFVATRLDGVLEIIGSATVDVAAGETTAAQLNWDPTTGGDWTVAVEVVDGTAPPLARALQVEPAPAADPASLFGLADLDYARLAALGSLLLAAALLAGRVVLGGLPGVAPRGATNGAFRPDER